MRQLNKPERKELRDLQKKHDRATLTSTEANRKKSLEMKKIGEQSGAEDWNE